MNASELIQKLQELISRYGDQEICPCSRNWEITDIIVSPSTPKELRKFILVAEEKD